MGLIINIDEALKQHSTYNILREPLNEMLREQQEAWERKNPIDMFFKRTTMDKFQETYSSSIGFNHAFAETSDYAVAPIFNTAEGFSATYRTKTFQGGFIITQQALEDGQYSTIKDTASAFMKRWHADIVEYGLSALDAAFGVKNTKGPTTFNGLLVSADTASGAIDDPVKNPLFSNAHTVVKRDDGGTYSFAAKTALNTVTDAQSNFFYAPINLANLEVAQLADVINQVITYMENLKDDNNKRAGVLGSKTIVCGNDAHLLAALNTALSMEMFNDMGHMSGLNPAYKKATVESSPYLLDLQRAGKNGFFIIDREYNNANHGLELTERVPLTLNAEKSKNPYGISYDGRQRFDINVASWRGIAYVSFSTSSTSTDWNYSGKMTTIAPVSAPAKPVTVVGTVTTTTASA